MGILLEKINESLKSGKGIADNFKNNSLFFYEKYQKSDNEVQSTRVQDIQIGRFYFFHYMDDSNWIKYSPVFTIGQKKFENLTILFSINLNMIPIQVRASFFDQFMTEKDFINDRSLPVEMTTTYNELFRYGFEYSIMEYNVNQISLVHRISMPLVPKFLYSGHPINKYDPNKLYEIWKVKSKTKYDRDKEMSQALIKDFYNISDDINENYVVLKKHIQRLQNSFEKYGR
jgi:hypothetical protein